MMDKNYDWKAKSDELGWPDECDMERTNYDTLLTPYDRDVDYEEEPRVFNGLKESYLHRIIVESLNKVLQRNIEDGLSN